MTRLLVVGDVHGRHDRLASTLEAARADGPFDAVLLVGDLGVDRPSQMRAAVVQTLEISRGLGAPVLFVPGNHDVPDLPSLPGATNVDDRVVEVAGIRVRGIGGAGPARFGFPYEWGEADVRRLPRLPADVLLCHAPPAGSTLDLCAHGSRAGSQAIRERLTAERPRVFACGHIHEAAGFEGVDGVACVNAGSLGSPFGRKQYVTVEMDDRGVVARHVVTGGETRTWSHPAVTPPR